MPVPAMIAAGVARPSAHGQAITRTAIAATIAGSMPRPASSQPARVAAAITSTTGTNTVETRSTIRWIGAFAAWASSTIRTIRASTVSVPTAPTSSTMRPDPLIEPPTSRSPGWRDTGRGSPVSIDSSTWVSPSCSMPSTGSRSPGSTTTRSPTVMLARGTIRSWPSSSRRAVSGRSPCSARIASVVRRRARASRYLPSSTSAITTAEPS